MPGRFRTQGLDHVAMTVADLERSQRFYEEVLGLERAHQEWQVPVVMVAGGTGLALFPEDSHPSSGDPDAPPPIRMLHIAFRVARPSFEAARAVLFAASIDFRFSDHGSAHSIYFHDPDGYEIELTTYEVDG